MNPSAEQVQNNGGEDEDGKDLNFLDSLPTGMVFAPTDDELIVYYLMKKIQNQPLPPNKIEVVNIYAFDPDQLPGMYKPLGRDEWFFFTPRERRYRKGLRPKRTTGDGHWKATGADKAVKYEDQTVGYRKALVYYRGEHKTNWIMHEYKAARTGPNPSRTGVNDETFDDIVVCRIYNKGGFGESAKRPRYESPRNDEIPQQKQQPIVQNLHGSASSVLPHNNHQVFSNPTGAINQLAFGREHESSPLQHQQQQPVMKVPEYPNSLIPQNNLQPQQPVKEVPEYANAPIRQNTRQLLHNPNGAINQFMYGNQSYPLQHQQPVMDQAPEYPNALPQQNTQQLLLNPKGATNQFMFGYQSYPPQHQQPVMDQAPEYANALTRQNTHQLLLNPNNGATNQLMFGDQVFKHRQPDPINVLYPENANAVFPENNLQVHHLPRAGANVSVPNSSNCNNNNKQMQPLEFSFLNNDDWEDIYNDFQFNSTIEDDACFGPAMGLNPDYSMGMNPGGLPSTSDLNANLGSTANFNVQVDHLPQAGANVSVPNNNSSSSSNNKNNKQMQPLEFSFMNDGDWDYIYNDFQFNGPIEDNACFGPAMGLNPDYSMGMNLGGLPSTSDLNGNLGSTANFNLGWTANFNVEYDMPGASFNQIPNNKVSLP